MKINEMYCTQMENPSTHKKEVVVLGFSLTEPVQEFDGRTILLPSEVLTEGVLARLHESYYIKQIHQDNIAKVVAPIFATIGDIPPVRNINFNTLTHEQRTHVQSVLQDAKSLPIDGAVVKKYSQPAQQINQPEPQQASQQHTQETTQQPAQQYAEQSNINSNPLKDTSSNSEEAPQPTQQTAPVANTETSVKWNNLINIPEFSTLTDEQKKVAHDTSGGTYGGYDHQPKLDHLGISKITTEEEYKQFLTDYVDEKITGPRLWANLNWFVDKSLLHTDLTSYSNDRLLISYLRKKHRGISLESYEQMLDLFEKVPNYLISSTGIPNFSNLYSSLNRFPSGIERFSALMNMYLGEPLEGFNLDANAKTYNPRTSILMPWFGAKDENILSDFRVRPVYVPVVDGKPDTSKYKAHCKVVTAYEGYAAVNVLGLNPVMEFRDNFKNMKLTIDSKGKFILTEGFGSSASPLLVLDNLLTLSDGATALPYPDSEGLFNGLTREQLTLSSNSSSTLMKYLRLADYRSEYEAIQLNGMGASNYVPFLYDTTKGHKGVKKDEAFKRILTQLAEEVEDISLEDLIDDTDSIKDHLMQRHSLTSDIICETVFMAMRDGQYYSQEFSDLASALMGQIDIALIAEVIRFSLVYGYATEDQILEEIDKISATGKNILTFNTPVTIEFELNVKMIDRFVDKRIKEIHSYKLEKTDSKFKVVSYITDPYEEKLIGLGFEVVEYKGLEPKKEVKPKLFIESIFRLRQIVTYGGMVCTNGFILADDFKPFDENEVFVKQNILNPFKVPEGLDSSMGDVKGNYNLITNLMDFRNTAISEYYVKTVRPAIAEAMKGNGTFNKEDFVNPPTILEQELKIVQENSEFVKKQKELTGEAVQETTTQQESTPEAKEERQVPVQETPQQQQVEVKQETPVEETQQPQGTLDTNPTSFKYGQMENGETEHTGSINAQYTVVIDKVILPVPKIDYTNYTHITPIGVITSVTNNVTKGLTQRRISLFDLHALLVRGQLSLSGSKVTSTFIDSNKQLELIPITDKQVSDMKDLYKSDNVENMLYIMNNMTIKEDGAIVIEAKQPTTQQSSQSAVTTFVETKKAFKAMYSNLTTLTERKYLVVGSTVTHVLYVENSPKSTASNSIIAKEDLIKEPNALKLLGFVGIENGNYLVETLTGNYIVFDSNLQEI